MKPANVRTDTFRFGKWYYDIVVDYENEMIDLWFSRTGFGVKLYIIGLSLNDDGNYSFMEEYMEDHLDESIEDFKAEYFDED